VERVTRIAFATYPLEPLITDDDLLVAQELAAHGLTVDAVPWDGDVEWDAYAAVLPRSTWDFHHRLREFRRWLDTLTMLGVPTLNPPRLLQWNLTKQYLRSLETLGIPVVPTLWATGHHARDFSFTHAVTRAEWSGGVVVKPIVSASAHDTWVADGTEPEQDERRFRAALEASAHGLMLQPFLPEVRTAGEWSLIFIGGRFSHAVLKRPADGDFRVQEAHGGSSVAANPDPEIVKAGELAVVATAECTQLTAAEILYARVDGVVRDGRFLLMEFEAVEPALFFGSAPDSAARMASAIASALARLHTSNRRTSDHSRASRNYDRL
jgi:glutathione synthase/RimK-type ligase-like ATP-grasp enzyme